MKVTAHTVINNLETFGKACIELAEQLTDSGRPLTPDEANLVRQAMLGWVDEIMHEIKVLFIVGSIVPDEAIDNLRSVAHAVYDMTR
ncbi:MAG: hypothetical protein ACXAEN_26455 [Candidatus Thorarchaeota archaeon]|jgi:hypothetical protein